MSVKISYVTTKCGNLQPPYSGYIYTEKSGSIFSYALVNIYQTRCCGGGGDDDKIKITFLKHHKTSSKYI
jgi:hypothetical protein